MLATRLTEILDCDHPVMLAGMGGVSYSALVAAVSDAGGFGTLGAAPMGLDRMKTEMAEVRSSTERPFGVDLLTALPAGLEEQVEAIIAGGASVFVAGLGVPRDVVELCHRSGVLVVNMCGKVRHAIAAVEAGCDIVVAQGTEAGGHTGTVATMPLVPQIVDAVGGRVPVVAAGGIVDGRGLAAAHWHRDLSGRLVVSRAGRPMPVAAVALHVLGDAAADIGRRSVGNHGLSLRSLSRLCLGRRAETHA